MIDKVASDVNRISVTWIVCKVMIILVCRIFINMKYAIAVLMVFTIGGCNGEARYLNLPECAVPLEKQIGLFETTNLCAVYYFDGNCSFCYASVLAIEDKCPSSVPRIYIYHGTDTAVINYNLELMGLPLKSCLFDPSNCFATTNRELKGKSIFLIDSTRRVLGAWDALGDDFFNMACQLAEIQVSCR
jgi:hypothetical protein